MQCPKNPLNSKKTKIKKYVIQKENPMIKQMETWEEKAKLKPKTDKKLIKKTKKNKETRKESFTLSLIELIEEKKLKKNPTKKENKKLKLLKNQNEEDKKKKKRKKIIEPLK